jgi:hypothetical protein
MPTTFSTVDLLSMPMFSIYTSFARALTTNEHGEVFYVPDFNKFESFVKSHSWEFDEGKKLEANILLNIQTKRIHRGGDGKKPAGIHEHHIIPRALQGHLTRQDNLIDLSPEDHFLVHLSLSAFFDHAPLCKATQAMSDGLGTTWTKDDYNKNILQKAGVADSLVKTIGKTISEANNAHAEYMCTEYWTEERQQERRENMLGDQTGKGTTVSAAGRSKISMGLLGNTNGRGNEGGPGKFLGFLEKR